MLKARQLCSRRGEDQTGGVTVENWEVRHLGGGQRGAHFRAVYLEKRSLIGHHNCASLRPDLELCIDFDSTVNVNLDAALETSEPRGGHRNDIGACQQLSLREISLTVGRSLVFRATVGVLNVDCRVRQC